MRTYGAKNADHEAKRQKMVALIAPVIMRAAPERPSLREMAKAAGVSVNNLRHYFGTREGVLEAVFEAMGVAGEPYMTRALRFTDLPVATGLHTLLSELTAAWTPEQLGGLHRSGISEGLGSEALGPSYLEHLLEPSDGLGRVALGDLGIERLVRAEEVDESLHCNARLRGKGACRCCRPSPL